MASPIKMAFMVKKYWKNKRIFKRDLIGRVSFEGTAISKYPPPNWVFLLISISYRHHSWKFTASIPSKVRNYTLLFLSIALQIFYKWFVLWQPSVRWQAIKKLSNLSHNYHQSFSFMWLIRNLIRGKRDMRLLFVGYSILSFMEIFRG